MKKTILNKVENLGYKILKEYPKHGKIWGIIEDKIGYKYDIQLGSLLKSVPYIVSINNPFSLENISLWLKLNNDNFELCENNIYEGTQNKLKFYHVKGCQEIFLSSWDDISQGGGCAICHGKQVGIKTSFGYLEPELLKQWSNKNKKSPFDYTLYSTENILWICSLGHEWYAQINNRTGINRTGCPVCADERKRIENSI